MSVFKSTRYKHHFTQYAQEVNESFAPDPVATYAASIIASGGDISSDMVRAIQTGSGFKLKQYYRLAQARFGNRFWNWTLNTSTGNIGSRVLTPKAVKAIIGDKPYTYIASIIPEFITEGTYLNYLIDNTFGLNEFNHIYQNQEYSQTDYTISDKGILVAKNDSNNLYVPVPERSKGFTYWDYSEPVTVSINEDTKIVSDYHEINDVPEFKYKVGTKVLVNETLEPYNPLGKQNNNSTVIDSKSNEELAKESDQEKEVIRDDTRKIYRKYVTVLSKVPKQRDGENYNEYTIKYTNEVLEITYNIEHHLYVTESGSTNSALLKYFFDSIKPINKTISGSLSSDTHPEAFKLYPYIPLKDFGTEAWNTEWLVPKLSTDDEIVQLQRIVDEALKDPEEQQEAIAEQNEANQVGRESQRTQRKSTRDKQKKEYDWKGRKYTLRALQRRLNRLTKNKHRIKMNKLYNASKELSESALKRRINKLSDLLGIDYESLALNMVADKNYSGDAQIKQRNIMPAVKFSSPLAEIQAYWYYFFKRLYKMYGEERDYIEWVSAVENANSLFDLPVKSLMWKNQSGLDWGGMKWLFIRKFEVQGKIRSIKRSRRLKEIKRGKPVNINSLAQLKEIIEPEHTLANDAYYTSKNGTDHCIGGEKFNTDGFIEGFDITKVLKDYSYTFFCKQKDKDTLEVIAVAGLVFHTKTVRSERWGMAWYDLGLQYARNKNRYGLAKSKDFVAQYETESRINKRHYYISKIQHFGIMPVDYNVIRRIGGVDLERIAFRIPMLYGFTHSEQKTKNKFVRHYLAPIIQITTFIISVLLALPTGGASLSLNVVVAAIIQAIITTVIVSVIMNHVLLPLLRAIGLKGIVAQIVAVIILIIAAYFGGQIMNGKDALPTASEIGKETATEVSKEVAKNSASQASQQAVKQNVSTFIDSITKSFSNIGNQLSNLSKEISNLTVDGFKDTLAQGFKDGLQQSLKQLGELSALNILKQTTTVGFAEHQRQTKAKLDSIQSLGSQENELYENAKRELDELQETIQNIRFDTKTVLENLRLRFRMYDSDSFLTSNTIVDNYSTTFEYLSNFITMKLNVDPATVDVAMTPDFSFKNKNLIGV